MDESVRDGLRGREELLANLGLEDKISLSDNPVRGMSGWGWRAQRRDG